MKRGILTSAPGGDKNAGTGIGGVREPRKGQELSGTPGEVLFETAWVVLKKIAAGGQGNASRRESHSIDPGEIALCAKTNERSAARVDSQRM